MTLLFAGLVDEPMKGFEVLHRACGLLWQRRQDFELVATGDPPGRIDEFTRFVGWLTQEELPRHLRDAGICVLPTIAQEALGRTAVEAMAAGRPVVASRLGGLPFTVCDGATGLLAEPGNADDLAAKIEILLDDPSLRERMGLAGRKRFEEHYAWPVIIDRHYRPLLRPCGPGTRRECESSNVRPDVGWDQRLSGRADPPILPRFLVVGRRSLRELAPPYEDSHDRSTPTAPQQGTSAEQPYRPYIPAQVDYGRISAEVSESLGLPGDEVQAAFEKYRAFHESQGYERTLGELKTLCFEEAFVLYCLFGAIRPRRIVEIGTQHGKSTRRLIDIQRLLRLHGRVTSFDVLDQVQHFSSDEAELVVQDITGVFRQAVLEAYRPDFVFLDVHQHGLVQEVVTETLLARRGWVLALHDCAPGLCNPTMAIGKDDPGVTSFTGVWERHVLAEAFGVTDPLSPELDRAETPSHRLRIFSTPHGLGLILPKRVVGSIRKPRPPARKAEKPRRSGHMRTRAGAGRTR